jgi:ABC-type nitrate/sulfonate/bicarbonate transport system permease component
MTTCDRSKEPTSTGRYFTSRYFRSRRAWLIAATLAIAAGLLLNWSWLVAAGFAPLLIAFAPCAVMCALGICMLNHGKGADKTQAS